MTYQTQWVTAALSVNSSFAAPGGTSSSDTPGPGILAYEPPQGGGNQVWPLGGSTTNQWSSFIGKALLPRGAAYFPYLLYLSGPSPAAPWVLIGWQFSGQLMIGQAPGAPSGGTGTLLATVNGAEASTDTEALGVLMATDYAALNEIPGPAEFRLTYSVPGAQYVEQLEGAFVINAVYATRAPASQDEAREMVQATGASPVYRL